MKENWKERVLRAVSEKNMYSIMNNTKWNELRNAVKELPFPPPYILKSVLEDEKDDHNFNNDVWYIGDWSDEAFLWARLYEVEWIKVRPRYVKSRGRLISDEIIDETQQFVEILRRYSIPYDELFNEIYRQLEILVDVWKNQDGIPKRAFVSCIYLTDTLAGINRFLSDRDSEKVENASIDINELLTTLEG